MHQKIKCVNKVRNNNERRQFKLFYKINNKLLLFSVNNVTTELFKNKSWLSLLILRSVNGKHNHGTTIKLVSIAYNSKIIYLFNYFHALYQNNIPTTKG